MADGPAIQAASVRALKAGHTMKKTLAMVRSFRAKDKDTPIVFQCHHGMRSRSAAEHFLTQGYRNVYNLTGGIEAWSSEVDPKVPHY